MSEYPQENFKAQSGEDRLLMQDFPGKLNGSCVEVGAFDGLDMSNTYFFDRLGWKCLLIEADPEVAKICQGNRPEAKVINCAAVSPGSPPEVSFQVSEDVKGMSSLTIDNDSRRRVAGFSGRLKIREITVPAQTLDSILEKAGWEVIDFMTIDVEGHESEVLAGFDINRWRPEVVLVERCGAFPVWSIAKYFDQAGYAFRRRTSDNDWYYRADGKQMGTWGLVFQYYVLPLPTLLPKAIALQFKAIAFKLGIYQALRRTLGR